MARKVDWVEIKRNGEVIATGYETQGLQSFEEQEWTERYLVIQSQQYALAQERGLTQRLSKATEAILALNVSK